MNTPTMKKEPSGAPRTDSASDAPDQAMPWFAMLGQWNVEIAALYGRRLQEWSAMPLRLMQCRSMDDLMDEHDDFSRRLMTDYRAASEKLVHACGSATPAKTGGTDHYAATLLKAQEDATRIIDQAKAQARQIIEAAEARREPSATKQDSAKAA